MSKDDPLTKPSHRGAESTKIVLVQQIECIPKTIRVLQALAYDIDIIPYKWVFDCCETGE